MLSGPTHGADKTKQASLLQKVLFGLMCLVGFIIFCSLFSHKVSSDDAMNGELLTSVSGHNAAAASHGTFISGLFEYFGNVTFLFPLIGLFICYRLVFSFASVNYKKINFFLVGICILGLDTMVLGLCPIFDNLAADDSTAGGILGEFFNQYFFNHFPAPVSGLLPMLIAFVGLMLFTNKGPLWYCDAVGSLFARYVLRRKDSRFEDSEKTEEKADDSSPAADPVQTSLSVFDTHPALNRDRLASKEETPVKEHVKPNITSLSGKHEPSFGDSSRIPPAPVMRSAAEFGQHSSGFGGNSASPFGIKSVSVSSNSKNHKSHTSNSPMAVFGRNNHKNPIAQRIEPQFGDLSLVDSKAQVSSPKVDENKPLYISPGVHTEDRKVSSQTQVSSSVKESADTGPKTFITGSPLFNTVQASEQVQEQSSESKTIIRDSRVHDEPKAPQVTVQKTIITKTVSSSSQTPAAAFETHSPAEPTTIVYKAGASHLAPTETIGSPMRHSEVSTVITRTTTTPADKVNPISSMSAGRVEGHYQENNSESNDSLKSFDNSYSDETQNMFPSVDEMEENVISFTDFLAREKQNHEIKVDSLTSAFIPSAQENRNESSSQDNRLEKNQSEPISESDAAFVQYSHGSRGVTSSNAQQTVNTANVQSSNASSASNVSAYESSSLNSGAFANSASELGNLNNQYQSSSANSYSENSYSEDAESDNDSDLSSRDDQQEGYSDKVPFENVSSITGSVPYGMTVEPTRKPITSMPTKAYSKSTETTPSREYSSWRPSTDLLARSNEEYWDNAEEIIEKTELINTAMRDFKIATHVKQQTTGPVITRYDLVLESGVRSKTIRNTAIDLQRILMSGKINMIDAVAKTPYFGIEVPNKHRKLITLGDIAQCVKQSNAKLPLCLGVDTVGNPIVADLATAPHLLIAGTTGSGKSAGVNSMMMSLLLKRSPDELRLIMVDPKTVEFTQYQNLPHLLTPIITDPFSALAAVSWLVSEMERRYKLLTSLRVPNIAECNELIRRENAKGNVVYDPAWSADMGGEPPILKPVPYIVLVIDEFADLMAVSAGQKKGEKSLDSLISRIVAKARAAGIHFILATQTPRADVVTGVIKANMPAKIAYTVQSSMDSRIILDEAGAENLLGNGDMIARFQKINNNELFRAHGPYSSTADVQAIVRAWIEEAGDPEYVEGVTDIEEEETIEDDLGSSVGSSNNLDEKFDAIVAYARDFCGASGKSLSISEIQTEFSIGWGRAKRIQKQLKAEGILDDKGYLR